MIITIGRQLGSGGLEIGRLLAERLNLAFYDKELLTEAARHSGICPECFQQVDEQAKRTFGGVGIFGMRFPFVGDGNTSYNSMISGDNLFLIQSETIVKLAENEQGAVFVGRCADYVLRAMQLPAGEHVVEWRFRAPQWGLISTITGIASALILIGAAVALWSVLRRKEA